MRVLKSLLFAPADPNPTSLSTTNDIDIDTDDGYYAAKGRKLRQGTIVFAPKLNTITGTGKALGGMLQRQDSLIRSLKAVSEHTSVVYFDWKPRYGTTQAHCTKGPSSFQGNDARTQYEVCDCTVAC